MKLKKITTLLAIMACLLLSMPLAASEWNEEDKPIEVSIKDNRVFSAKMQIRDHGDYHTGIDMEKTLDCDSLCYSHNNRTSYLYYKVYDAEKDSWSGEIPIFYFGTFDRASLRDRANEQVCRDVGADSSKCWMALTRPAANESKVGTFKITNSSLSKMYETVKWGRNDDGSRQNWSSGFTQHALKVLENLDKAYDTDIYMEFSWTAPTCVAGKKVILGIQYACYNNYETYYNQRFVRQSDTLSVAVLPSDLVPVFSPEAGSYEGSGIVSLSCPVPNSVIYYTTDNSTPGGEDLYTGPFSISGEVTVNATAATLGSGGAPDVIGKMVSATYNMTILDYVDLNLPSGLMWAVRNVGAEKAEDYGDFYSWGETKTKTTYKWSNYKWGHSMYHLTKYQNDNKLILDSQDDAAYMNWGTQWHMPTDEDFRELFANCTYERTVFNDVQGVLFTSKTNTGKLFLPAAGDAGAPLDGELYYWASTVYDNSMGMVYRLKWLKDGNPSIGRSDYPYYGASVRPVWDPNAYVEGYLFLEGSPTKTTNIKVGSTFDPAGIKVSYLPPDGAVEDVTDKVTWRISPAIIPCGCTSVTISASYMGKTVGPMTVNITTDASAVDLGLSVKWGEFNIGASAPEYCGNYYDWSDETKDYIHAAFESGWRLPTQAEMEELQNTTQCAWEWFGAGNSEYGGTAGYRITGRTGKSIFLPAAGSQYNLARTGRGSVGNYWIDKTDAANSKNAYYMCFDLYDRCSGSDSRSCHKTIRLVKEK